MRDRGFLGQSLAFPLQFSPRGEIALASGDHDTEQSIRIVLETIPGERVMRPKFGCRDKELVFAPRNSAAEAMLTFCTAIRGSHGVGASSTQVARNTIS